MDSKYFSRAAARARALVAERKALTFESVASTLRKGIFDIKADTYVEPGIGVPFIRIGDLENGLIREDSTAWISMEAHTKEKATAMRRGDIAVSKTGAPAASLITFDDSNISQDIIGIRLTPDSAVSAPFVVAFLNSKTGLALLRAEFQGNVQEHLSLADMRRLPIPEISRELQEGITRAFEQAIAKRSAAATTATTAERELNQAMGTDTVSIADPQSFVRRARDLRNAERWDSQFHSPLVDEFVKAIGSRFKISTLGAIGEVTNGSPVSYAEDGDVPILRSGDLNDIENEDRLLRARGDQPMTLVERGDVLVSSIGFGSIGKVAVFDKEARVGTVSEVTIIRQSLVDPYFLAAFLRSRPGQLQINRWITGATGQLHLYPRDIRKILVPIGPADLQLAMRESAENARRDRALAQALLLAANRTVDIAVESGDGAAQTHLRQVGV